MQHQLKFGLTCGIVGILLLGCAALVRSAPPFVSKQPSPPATLVECPPQPQKLPLSAQMVVSGQTILLEVARTQQEQSTGLMYRTQLPANRGMLFVFSPPRPVSFWMKNTLIPLDMVFVSNGVVKHIIAQVPPCRTITCPGYGPDPKIEIDSVIELSSGRAAELRLKVGDRLKVDGRASELRLKVSDRLKVDNYSAKILKSR